MRRYPLLVVNVAALVLTACSSNVCGPGNCASGCCSSTNECITTTTEQQCGKGGEACRACATGETCGAGVCLTGSGGGAGGGSGGGGAGGGFESDAGIPRCDATAPLCQDESIMQLRLFDTVNPAPVTEEGVAPNFFTLVDARAGGASPNQSFTYMSFTPTGLTKLDLSDETAFTSLDWDIALRRYVLRVNSGVSGPSCVDVARTAPNTDFNALQKTPSGLQWRTEEYFSGAACDYVPDTSGIGAPGTALSSFWTYQACVQMTLNVYVVRLRDGRYVKLRVLSYYSPQAQDVCDQTGNVPTPNDAALVRIQWGFIAPPD